MCSTIRSSIRQAERLNRENAMYKKNHHIHFVGIGGIGMSGIAEVLINLGYSVSGSDLQKTETTERLSSLGAAIHYGHSAGHIRGADVVVVSSAVKSDNPETAGAREHNIPVIPRAEMLGELMRLKYGIAVAGAHGKTTTTSLVAAVLDHGDIDPTVVIGGKLNKTNTNAVLGSGEFMVAEADESDGSFLKLPPTIAVVTNIDREHMDHYRDIDDIKSCFLAFLNKVPFYGLCIICLDNENVQSLIPHMEKRTLSYGCASQADLQARGIKLNGTRTQFDAYYHEKLLGPVTLNLPGMHNAYNALAAIGVGLELELPFDRIQQALSEFRGIQRRFQLRAEKKGIAWIDDYGHHPTEIKMTLASVKALKHKRVVVLFQPHRYSRTKALFSEFMTAFYDADVLIVSDIYAAGEAPVAGIDAEQFYAGLKKYGHKDVSLITDPDKTAEHLHAILSDGDILVTLGAGDIWKIGDRVMHNI